MISSFNGSKPFVHKTVFVHKSACVIGNVSLAEHSSVWCCASIRADLDSITVGKSSNVQDCAVLHTDKGFPVVVGDDVTIGHNAVLHGCAIGSNTLIGIGAVVLNGAVVGKNCIVGAGAVVTEKITVPDNSLVLGVPGKVVREVGEAQISMISGNAADYVALKNRYMRMKSKIK